MNYEVTNFSPKDANDWDLDRLMKLPLFCPYFTQNVARHKDNFYRNRYIDMLPYDNSRVQLKPTPNNSSGYINASFVKMFQDGCNPNYYIAAQGPLDNTCEDFWQMVWDNKVLLIVMVTGFKEAGIAKCSVYLPQTVNSILNFGDFSIQALVVEETIPNIIKTDIMIKYKEECQQITHFRHTKWSDHSVPANVQEFGDFLNQINQCRITTLISSDKNPNWMLVHCSAGIGRTGTVILCDSLQKFLADSLQKPINIAKQLLQLRWQRANACRSGQQIMFVCQFLLDCMKKNLSNKKKLQVKN